MDRESQHAPQGSPQPPPPVPTPVGPVSLSLVASSGNVMVESGVVLLGEGHPADMRSPSTNSGNNSEMMQCGISSKCENLNVIDSTCVKTSFPIRLRQPTNGKGKITKNKCKKKLVILGGKGAHKSVISFFKVLKSNDIDYLL